jgi:DnaJ-class molecular chaperone
MTTVETSTEESITNADQVCATCEGFGWSLEFGQLCEFCGGTGTSVVSARASGSGLPDD